MVYFKEENSNTGKKSFQLQEIFYTTDFGVLKAVPLFYQTIFIYLSIYQTQAHQRFFTVVKVAISLMKHHSINLHTSIYLTIYLSIYLPIYLSI